MLQVINLIMEVGDYNILVSLAKSGLDLPVSKHISLYDYRALDK